MSWIVAFLSCFLAPREWIEVEFDGDDPDEFESDVLRGPRFEVQFPVKKR